MTTYKIEDELGLSLMANTLQEAIDIANAIHGEGYPMEGFMVVDDGDLNIYSVDGDGSEQLVKTIKK